MIVVYADGIGSAAIPAGDERSILLAAAQHLATKRDCPMVRVEWPASIGPVGGGMSWSDAAKIGVEEVDQILAANPLEPVVLLGYSGGCKVVHDWLETRPSQLDRIAAVGFISDPFRPKGLHQHGTPPPEGYGICGAKRGPIPGRTFWSAWVGDVITDCPDDSPLRTAADLSKNTPGGVLGDLGKRLRLGNWQLANYMKLWRRDPLAYLFSLGRRMDEARRGIEGYLGVEHTLAYTRSWGEDGRSYAVRLADTINYALGVRGYGRTG